MLLNIFILVNITVQRFVGLQILQILLQILLICTKDFCG